MRPLILINTILAHSNIFSPYPRGNKKNWGFCSRGLGCHSACETPKNQAPINSPYYKKVYIKRGENFTVSWKRLNHPGGFVRLALVPFDLSDSHKAFDDHVVKYTCFETNCKELKEDHNLGKLNGPGSPTCSTNITIPSNLRDGPVTLQWTWFGGGVYYANPQASFPNYVSCTDLTINGGEPLNKSIKPIPIFQGGDAANPGKGVCRYWSSNSINGCPMGSINGTECGLLGMMNGKPLGY